MFRSDRDRDDAPVSLRGNYDGARLVNTPLSILACKEEGIRPEQLLKPNSDDPYGSMRRPNMPQPDEADAPDGDGADRTEPTSPTKQGDKKAIRIPKPPKDIALQKAKVEAEHRERQRQRLLATAKGRHAILLAKQQHGHVSPGRTSKTETHDGEEGDKDHATDLEGTAQRGTVRSLHTLPAISPRGTRGADADDEDGELQLAKQFLVLKQAAERRAKMQKQVEQKDQHVREFQAKQAEIREKKAQEAARQAEEVRKKTLENYQKSQRVRRLKSMHKIVEKDQKIEHAKESVKKSRSPPDPLRGEKEREAAAKRDAERLQKINEKITKAQESARRRAEEVERERELKAFQTELQMKAQEEQNERARRMLEFKKEQMNDRVETMKEKRERLERERAEELRQKMLKREKVSRRKEDIQEYIAQHEGEDHIEPPAWLQDAVRKLQSRESPRSASQSKYSTSIPNSPRAATSGVFSDSASHASDKSPRGRKNKFVAEERFTVFTADQPKQRCFPKWMYDE